MSKLNITINYDEVAITCDTETCRQTHNISKSVGRQWLPILMSITLTRRLNS